MALRLGDILIQQGVIDGEKLTAALSDQRAFGGKLGRTLVDLGYVSEDQLVHALATQLGLETVDLSQVDVPPEALSVLPVDACERYGVFPVRVDTKNRVLWLATVEPDQKMLQEIAQIAQHTVEPVLCSMSSIDRAIRRYYFGDPDVHTDRLGEPLRSIPGAQRNGEDELTAAAVVPGTPRVDPLAELRTIVVRLEKQVSAQARAFRALVEILQDKGIVRRGELGSQTTKSK
jgi:type IV pilus assembly protein PilB